MNKGTLEKVFKQFVFIFRYCNALGNCAFFLSTANVSLLIKEALSPSKIQQSNGIMKQLKWALVIEKTFLLYWLETKGSNYMEL